jgi:pimeloyl-ACP methyl ester carboxylesterase
LQLAIRHPDLVRKLVLASISFTSDGMHAVALEMFPSITPELFAGSPVEQAYLQTAPNTGDFPRLVEKLKRLHTTDDAWAEENIRAIAELDRDAELPPSSDGAARVPGRRRSR